MKLQQKTFVVVSKAFSKLSLYDRLTILAQDGTYNGFRTIVNIELIQLKDIDQKTTFLDKECIKETYLDIMQSCYNYKLEDFIYVLTLSSYTFPETVLDYASNYTKR